MNILLINPPIDVPARGRALVARLFYNSMPLGIGYLAAVAIEAGHRARIIDAAVERIGMARLLAQAADFGPDLIGVTGVTTSYASTTRTLREMRRRFPKAVLVVGGPHLSAWGTEALKDLPVDAGLAGEGEAAFADLLQALREGRPLESVSGIMAPDGKGGWRETGPRRFVKNLDTLPFPARHLFPIGRYRPIPADYRKLPKIPIISTRGCPYGCVFCDKSVFGRVLRGKSPERTVEEMRHCITDHGARGIAFLDSTFGTRRRRAEAICEEILKKGLKTEWTCTLRADSVDERLLRLFRRAGCWRVRLGIETGDPEILRRMDKGETLEHIRRAAVAADRAGLQVKAFFQVGHLGETPETIKRSIAFARSLPLMEVTVQINTPMKNTPQESLWPKFGRLITDNHHADSNFWEPIFIPNGMTSRDLVQWQNRFYRSFMLRPSVFWRHLKKLRGASDIRRYFSAASLLLFLFFNREPPAAERKAA